MPTPEYCFLWIQWWPLCMTKAEWSGWVQAIGSILAILTSAAVVWWQVGRQHRLQMTAEERRSLEHELHAIRDACTLANYAAAQTSELIKLLLDISVKDRRFIEKEFEDRDFELIERALNNIDSESFTRPASVLAFLRIQRTFPIAVAQLRFAIGDRGGYTDDFRADGAREAQRHSEKLLPEIRTLQDHAASLEVKLAELK